MNNISRIFFFIAISASTLSVLPISKLEKAQNHFIKGCELLNNKKYQKALEQVNSAIELDSNNPNFWDKLGTVYFSMQNYPSAISAYTRAISLSPQIGFYYTERALVYFAMGNQQATLNDLIIAANLGEPRAQEIIAAHIATHKAQQDAYVKQQTQKTLAGLEERFGYKPGTLRSYM
jgi:tetratricopeptide (TPR) repeat protein